MTFLVPYVTDAISTYHKYRNVNWTFSRLFYFAWIIEVFDSLFLLIFAIFRCRENIGPERPENLLIGFHIGICTCGFALLCIAIYKSIQKKPEKLDQNRDAEEPTAPDQVKTKIEEEENANGNE